VGVGLAALAVAQRHPLAGVDHLALVAGALDGVVQPRLQADAVLEHHAGAGDGVDVGRGRLVVVGVDVRLDQAGHADPVAADHPGEVGHLGGGGDHPQRGALPAAARPGRPVAAAAPGRQDRHQAGDQGDPAAAHGDSPRGGVVAPS
jgi:hypothetical protein